LQYVANFSLLCLRNAIFGGFSFGKERGLSIGVSRRLRLISGRFWGVISHCLNSFRCFALQGCQRDKQLLPEFYSYNFSVSGAVFDWDFPGFVAGKHGTFGNMNRLVLVPFIRQPSTE